MSFSFNYLFHIKKQVKHGILVTVMVAFLSIGCNDAPKDTGSNNQPAVPSPKPVKANKNQIVGKWERTDAPYQLLISAPAEGGTMKAEYLNPKPIHVSKAMWAQTGDAITMYVELRDQNYPGSYYQLSYEPSGDVLSGTYFQAVESNTYNVMFTRVN